MEVDGAAIEAAIDYLKRRTRAAVCRSAKRCGCRSESIRTWTLEISGAAADGPIGDLLARLQERAPFTEHVQPAGLHASSRAYQVRGFVDRL